MKASLRQNALLKFLVGAGITYITLYLIYEFAIKRFTSYDQAFIGSIISHTDFLLRSLGYKTFLSLQDVDFQVIGIDGSNGVWVGSNCNAISLFILFSVFIIWYPGHQRSKLFFIPLGILSIHILNTLRVTALAIIAFHYPSSLDFNHSYTFTFLVYSYIFILWIWWVNSFANKPSSNEIKP